LFSLDVFVHVFAFGEDCVVGVDFGEFFVENENFFEFLCDFGFCVEFSEKFVDVLENQVFFEEFDEMGFFVVDYVVDDFCVVEGQRLVVAFDEFAAGEFFESEKEIFWGRIFVE
jgi:hypothetical protein